MTTNPLRPLHGGPQLDRRIDRTISVDTPSRALARPGPPMTAAGKRYDMNIASPGAMRTVSDDEADIRLDRWFRRHFPGVPQSAIQKLCRTGQLRVDGKRAEAATRLASGQA